ncbi:4Fe-4S binding protein [Peptacetobacter sp.]|uniref:4Fe-4S binding protein n=1 Tax=Peptacetobacter sp. TaxID=2991975 RepID=UPI00263903B9|nr:4Fe-4S binding protein [Peptacetobacter sp.]
MQKNNTINTKISKRFATVDKSFCVACGCCIKVCPKNAISIKNGLYADVDLEKCIGCGLCSKECPASVIDIKREVLGGVA